MLAPTASVLLMLFWLPFGPSAATTVFVSPSGEAPTRTLSDAVLDPGVTEIVLTSNYTIEDDFLYQQSAPYQLTRNVSVTALHGTDDVLDLQFQRSKIQLCSTCVWTWRNVTTANESWGGSPGWDLFVGPVGGAASPIDGKALVVAENVIRWHWSCSAAKYTMAILWTIQRPSVLPQAPLHQEARVATVTWQDTVYPDALILPDFGTVVPCEVQEGRGATGGFGVWDRNVTLLCVYPVGADCLDVKSADTCISERIDRALADQSAAQAAAHRMSAGHLAAAITVPVIAVLAAAAAAVTLHRHKKQKAMQAQEQQARDEEGKQVLELQFSRGIQGASAMYVQRWLDSDNSQGRGRDSIPSCFHDYHGPMDGRRGWELTNSLTNSCVELVEDARVFFDGLLGSGSFGHVYKGTWNDRTVAIKVIEYDSTIQTEVEDEVQLMLSANHPNIVHAYYCVTYTYTGVTSAGSNNDISNRTAPGTSRGPGTAAAAASSAAAAATPLASNSHYTESSGTDLLSADNARPPSNQQQSDQQQIEQQQQQSDVDGSAKSLPVKGLLKGITTRARADLAAAVKSLAAGCTSPNTGSSRNNLPFQQVQRQQEQDDADVADQNGGDQQEIQAREGRECWTISERIEPGQENPFGLVMEPQLGPALGAQQVETWLVQEYCDCGTLGQVASQLREDRSIGNRTKLVLLLLDVANGLKVLHSRNTVHGDLNSRNVLVTRHIEASAGYIAKLADLGLARVILKHRPHRTIDSVGTMRHMPPELLRCGKQSPAGDIYAFGIMMWELYTGDQAFKNLQYGQFFESVVQNNVRPPLPHAMPADYLLLMDHCWAADPADRPTADRLIQCIEFMIQERRKSTPANSRQSSAILPAYPRVSSRRSSTSTTFSRRNSAANSERRLSASSSELRMSERRSSGGTFYGGTFYGDMGAVYNRSRRPSSVLSGSGYGTNSERRHPASVASSDRRLSERSSSGASAVLTGTGYMMNSERRYSASVTSSERRMSDRRSSGGWEMGPISASSRGPTGISSGSGHPAVVSGVYKESSGLSHGPISPRYVEMRTHSGIASLAGWATSITEVRGLGAGTSSAAFPALNTPSRTVVSPVASNNRGTSIFPGAPTGGAGASSPAGLFGGVGGNQNSADPALGASRYLGSFERGTGHPPGEEAV